MSRNLKYKPGAPAVPSKSKKTVLAKHDSSDDDYSGVDLISDSDEEEPDVEKAEEEAIIASAEDDDDAAPQPDNDDDQSSWAGFDVDEMPAFVSDDPFFEDNISRTVINETAAWDAPNSRRVRFDLSESDISDTDDTIFPDIFLDQNSLDPSFRRAIENDHYDEEDAPSSDESYWDFHGDNGDVLENADVAEVDTRSESSFGSSGYESG
jgi:hypothetical protein